MILGTSYVCWRLAVTVMAMVTPALIIYTAKFWMVVNLLKLTEFGYLVRRKFTHAYFGLLREIAQYYRKPRLSKETAYKKAAIMAAAKVQNVEIRKGKVFFLAGWLDLFRERILIGSVMCWKLALLTTPNMLI